MPLSAPLSFTTEPTANDGEVLRDKGHLFITSVLQNVLGVNPSAEKSAKNSSELDESARKSKDVEANYDITKKQKRCSIKRLTRAP